MVAAFPTNTPSGALIGGGENVAPPLELAPVAEAVVGVKASARQSAAISEIAARRGTGLGAIDGIVTVFG